MQKLILLLMLVYSFSGHCASVEFNYKGERGAVTLADLPLTKIATVRGESPAIVITGGGDGFAKPKFDAEISKAVADRSGITLEDILSVARRERGKVIVTLDDSRLVVDVQVEEIFSQK